MGRMETTLKNLEEAIIRTRKCVKTSPMNISDLETLDKAIRSARLAHSGCSKLNLTNFRNKSRVDQADVALKDFEVKFRKELKIKQDLNGEKLKKMKETFDQLYEESSDASALLNSDVADHLSPEDIYETTNATKEKLTPLRNLLEKIREFMIESDDLDKRLAHFAGYNNCKLQISELRNYINKQNVKYNDIKNLIEKYKKKADHDVHVRKKEEEEQKRKEEREQQKKEAELWLDETKEVLNEFREEN